MKFVGVIITINLLLAVSLSGCSSPETAPDALPSGQGIIVCEVFYRSSSGEGLEAAPLITFSEGNDLKAVEFDTMMFEAQFQDDDYEGRALRIVVTDQDNGDEITRQLYQFDKQNPVENQFVGGHGFTGLNYIFQSDSSAEVQFFCSVK